MKRRRRPVQDKGRAYRQLWRIVEGAIADAFAAHPDYLTERGRHLVASSVTKRVVGAVMGYAEQSARGRSGEKPAADSKASHVLMAAAPGGFSPPGDPGAGKSAPGPGGVPRSPDSNAGEDWASPATPPKAVCRGSWALGTACGRCDRCRATQPGKASSE